MTGVLLAAALCGGVDSVTDIEGATHTLDGPTVFVFVKTKCPIANYYQPTLRRLAGEWGEDVTLVQVHTESRVDAAAAMAHREEYNAAGVVVVDPDHSLIEAFDATVTPEAVVVDGAGEVRYRGRIDNTYLAFGKRRQAATSPDLANAVEAILAGRSVPVAKTEAVGCRIRRHR